MKTIGILGGMSWESTAIYYRLLNESVRRRCGGHHSARVLLLSIDFAPLVTLQQANQWDQAADWLVDEARRLQRGGADLLLIASNTMHKVADQVDQATTLPLLHIADATAADVRARGLNKVGFLGTRYSMEQDFYTGRLRDKHAIETLIPEPESRQRVHQVIFDELCQGQVLESSRRQFQAIAGQLQRDGAQALIAGCTEIGMLLREQDVALPLLDTARIHAEAAIEWALRDGELNSDARVQP